MKENADKARALDTPEIQKQLRESGEQMFRLRFQLRMGQTDGLKKLRSLRKERARMLTVLRERELNPEAAPKPAAKPKAAKKAKAAAKPKAPSKAKAAATARPAGEAKPAARKKSGKSGAGKVSKG